MVSVMSESAYGIGLAVKFLIVDIVGAVYHLVIYIYAVQQDTQSVFNE